MALFGKRRKDDGIARINLLIVQMPALPKNQRFIFKTKGVCPSEIHFRIDGECLADVQFMGGGCPGNARLVARLLQGLPVDEIRQMIDGIDCRNGTSCPDQLAAALQAVAEGHLQPTESFRLFKDPRPHARFGLIGELAGNPFVLEKIAENMSAAGVRNGICVGNLTGDPDRNRQTVKLVRKLKLHAVQGQRDWEYTLQNEARQSPPVDHRLKDWLTLMPQVLRFELGHRKGIAFFGDYIQRLPGYSDYEPYALEINIVCGLTNFMQDKSVFPALEAMVSQFRTHLVLFGQTGRWGQWHVGDTDFISLGPAADGHTGRWGLLESDGDKIRFEVMTVE